MEHSPNGESESHQEKLAYNRHLFFETKETSLMQYLNMISRLNLAKTCKSWYVAIKPQEMWYQKVHPGWLDIDDCKKLNQTSYTHALIYYARENNAEMFNFIHDNASEKNKKISLSIYNALNKDFRNQYKKEVYKSNLFPYGEDESGLVYPHNIDAVYKALSDDTLLKFKKNLMKRYATNDYFSYFKRLQKRMPFRCRSSWERLNLGLKEKMMPYIMHIFLLQGMDVNWQFEKDESSFLHFIAEENMRYCFVGQIINHPQINVSIKNKYGSTPLHCTIFKTNKRYSNKIDSHIAIMQKILDNSNTDLNAQDKKGKTPLLLALEYHRKDLIELLLKDRRSNLNIVDNEQNAPLHYPIIYQFSDLICTRDVRPNPNIKNKEGNAPLHCISKSESVIFLLGFEDIDIDIQNLLGETPLHCSIRNPDKKNNYPDVPGHEVAMKPTYTFKNTQYLLEYAKKPNINAKNNEGKTPLHYAVEEAVEDKIKDKENWHQGITIAMELLLNHGAEINFTDNKGRTPLDYAFDDRCFSQSDKKEIIELLQKHGALQSNCLSRAIKSIDSIKNEIAPQSFFQTYKKMIFISSLLSIIGISATILAYFNYNTHALTK